MALTNHRQQADTGTKMIHIGRNTQSTIISKGISAGHGSNTYRGLVQVIRRSAGARNYTQCDSLLIGDKCGGPHLPVRRGAATRPRRSSTRPPPRKIGEDQLFYCEAARPLGRRRGVDDRERVLPGSVPGTAHGVRGRGARSCSREPRRQGRLNRNAEGAEVERGRRAKQAWAARPHPCRPPPR